MSNTLFKTTIVLYTDFDTKGSDISDLACEVDNSTAKMDTIKIEEIERTEAPTRIQYFFE